MKIKQGQILSVLTLFNGVMNKLSLFQLYIQ